MRQQTDFTWLFCACGQALRCAVAYEGERLGSLRFYDFPQPGETHAEARRERVTCCPGCGARLDHRLLVEALLAPATR